MDYLYEIRFCSDCGRRITVNLDDETDRREVNGQRHVCTPVGEPLQRSRYSGLDPLGGRPEDTLRK